MRTSGPSPWAQLPLLEGGLGPGDLPLQPHRRQPLRRELLLRPLQPPLQLLPGHRLGRHGNEARRVFGQSSARGKKYRKSANIIKNCSFNCQ